MTGIRVVLADEHMIVLEGLKKLLEPYCTVVRTVTDGRSLLVAAEELCPDVIITETSIPQLNGFEACLQITRKLTETRLIFLTANEDRESAEEAVRRGASGYLLKKGAATELFKAIQHVMAGRIYITPLIWREPVSIFVSQAKSRRKKQLLSERQREVLQLLAEGKSMKEAADILNITGRTVAYHKYSMMERLGVTSNSQLVRYAQSELACAAA